MHAEDGVARLQMENHLAVPGDGCRYPTEIIQPHWSDIVGPVALTFLEYSMGRIFRLDPILRHRKTESLP